ncbi:DNA cytosine methyltransferase [Commensalibacter communis]|uniref:DNA cytosine methyltransferase n=1 Tax=Commensalibacter communis TaxID=2972786 RepID=UPI0022FF4F67|nr:DNA cytosine methyltransferase [Commensalibacter communis]CAI3933706.1 DNA-cytosine methylase (Dcm) (PDB:3LX6) [Commensalibacter communis]CAI3944508.1 DNA-cytosine methylase (Dcm) (PDB:3LX6) [Commensalibacter communis]
MIYYNENNKFAANWLEKLMQSGLIPFGIVDRRSITEVEPEELKYYTQCHFFAGIGGWSYALKLAGWDMKIPVWTGSCPCQPFSVAGNKKGFNDERDLWPVWFKLIQECKPTTIFGEQVESAIKYGWLDRLSDDLEAENYAIGSAVLPACSVGALHQRKRLWWVANSYGDERGGKVREIFTKKAGQASGNRENVRELYNLRGAGSSVSSLANTDSERLQRIGINCGEERWEESNIRQPEICSGTRSWEEAEYIQCTDGKFRAIEPSIRLLVDGFPARMGLLRGFGNAIVPQNAAKFIQAFKEIVA